MNQLLRGLAPSRIFTDSSVSGGPGMDLVYKVSDGVPYSDHRDGVFSCSLD